MCLKVSCTKVIFTVNVNSVFDIGWYSIARMMTANSGSLDYDMNNNSKNIKSKHANFCRSCGKVMEIKVNRQLYCNRY